ncbi:UNVERIFIED_CONTAM: Aspartic proteinase-like protein 2 [Sesamum angustifolium]|uniref:Aspartic proteinase-like protein 2 n=1 Tax=Sesamum angustifolium TaxID=2727405 RepID=A0AAW2PT52_9LAMI
MDTGRRHLPLFLILSLLVELVFVVQGNVVFEVRHKYGGPKAQLRQLRDHDSLRHGRMLGTVDLCWVVTVRLPVLRMFDIHEFFFDMFMYLMVHVFLSCQRLYYTKITIGNPPLDYHVQVDTGSDIVWVNCKDCDNCPPKTGLRITLRQYDLKASSTGTVITCDQQFCTAVSETNPNCKAGMNCAYTVTYGDGTKTEGYYVRDDFKLDQVTGNHQTSAMNGSIAFGEIGVSDGPEVCVYQVFYSCAVLFLQNTCLAWCSTKQAGDSSSSQAIDGLIGFGQDNTSIISQLASLGKVKKVFSHCLDSKKGGGIFAIGEVVEPKVNKTRLVPRQLHYNAVMEAIDVAGKQLDFPKGIFGLPTSVNAVIDSGTTLAYLPSDLYKQLMDMIMAQHQEIKLHTVEDLFKCFWYNGNIDDGFPVIKFHFEDSLSLTAYPHNYLFEVKDEEYCIGWQSSVMKSRDGTEMTLLGDIVLADKLFVYDIENQTIGWTQYDCGSSIKVKDEKTGSVYDVAAHNISSGSNWLRDASVSFLLFITVVLNLIA